MALDMDDLFLRSRFYRLLGFVSHLREFRVDTGFRRRELQFYSFTMFNLWLGAFTSFSSITKHDLS